MQRCAALHVLDPCLKRDSLIAATAFVHRLIVVTRDVRDFEPMGVKLLNPWSVGKQRRLFATGRGVKEKWLDK